MMLVALLGIALLGYQALAADAGTWYAGYTWHVSGRRPLAPEWHAVSSYEVQARCSVGRREGHWSNACAWFDERGGVCHVYASQSEAETPAWLRWHELLHCAGWDHDEP
jgi:hypothetical protein